MLSWCLNKLYNPSDDQAAKEGNGSYTHLWSQCDTPETVCKLKNVIKRIIQVKCIAVHDIGNINCVRRLDGGIVQQDALLMQKH